MKKVLIAGIGNIFMGDDGFGCDVLRQMNSSRSPEGVVAIDFGIRSYDLAFALTNGYDAVVLVDAVGRGHSPGTVYLIEPKVADLENEAPAAVDAHSLNPVAVIQMARSLGGVKGKLYLVGCEPESFGGEAGKMGLSQTVANAVPQAIMMIENLLVELLSTEQTPVARLVTT